MKKFFTLIAAVLMAVSAQAQTWNFNLGIEDYPGNDKANLDAAVKASAGWALLKGGGTDIPNRFNNTVAIADEQLAANDQTLELAKGIYFTASATRIRLNAHEASGGNNSSLSFNGTGIVIHIKNLKKDYQVKFVTRSTSSDLARTISLGDNVEKVSGFEGHPVGNPKTESVAKVKADGDVTFTSEQVNVYSITVLDASGTELTKDQVVALEPAADPTFVTAKTIWTCTDAGDENRKLQSVNVLNYNDTNLFFRSNNAGGSRAMLSEDLSLEGKLYGENINISYNLKTQSNGDFAPAATAKANDPTSNATDRCMAINVEVPGHLIVYMRPVSPTEGRNVLVFFNGDKKLEKASTDWKQHHNTENKAVTDYDVVDVANTVKGSYFIGGTVGVRVAAIIFFPDADYAAIADADKVFTESGSTAITTIEANVQKAENGAIFNLAGQKVNKSYKGVVIINGKKMLNK